MKRMTMNGNGQVVVAGVAGHKSGRGRGLVGPRFSRCLRRVAAGCGDLYSYR